MVQFNNINTTENTVQTVKAPVAATANQANTSTDSVRKEIQGKIMNAQKKSQELSLNTEMTAQERENRDLKRELRLREEEEKKKQQEAEKAAAQKEERQKEASRKTITEQDENSNVQRTDNKPQTEISEPNNRTQANDSNADGEVREILPEGLHNVVSNASSIRQYRVIQNVSAQFHRTASIQESEINQDAARGADVKELKETQRKAFQKETQRMETMQSFIFGNKNNRAAEQATGVRNHISQGFRENGLYNNNGTLFRNNFESVQMDITLSGI